MLLNGASIRSCITLAVQADGAEVSTVEGLAAGGELHPLQDEFSDKQGLQCGYCTPGMLMRAQEILAQNPDPTAEQVRAAIASNLCRAPATSSSSRPCSPPPRACARQRRSPP